MPERFIAMEVTFVLLENRPVLFADFDVADEADEEIAPAAINLVQFSLN